MASTNLPTRTTTNDDDAMPDEDTSQVTKLFLERLQAWKHACAYLEDYVQATEKMQHQHVKEYEKCLKTVNSPLKEGHHFDQSPGGITGMFDNIRTNTQGLANSHTETAKQIKGTVLPIFDRLHTEIKNKNKEISKGAGKGSKAVDKAQSTTQKHIELLGQHTSALESGGLGKTTASNDPYVTHRVVHHHLNNQIQEENANRKDLIAVQNSFAQFEAHVIQTFQTGISSLNQVLSHQGDQARNFYGNMTSTSQQVPADFEWNGFVQRNNNLLIDPNSAPRSIQNVSFPNQNHKTTQPLIAGSLERKSKVLKKYEPGYYAVTPAQFLHEYKTDDDFAKEPSPEVSLYLPDCTIGALDGTKFAVKGKDSSKGGIGNKFSMSHEYQFRAQSPKEAEKWYEIIKSVAGQTTSDMPEGSAPSSPVESRQASSSNAPSYATNDAPSAVNNSAERYAAGPTEGVSSYDRA